MDPALSTVNHTASGAIFRTVARGCPARKRAGRPLRLSRIAPIFSFPPSGGPGSRAGRRDFSRRPALFHRAIGAWPSGKATGFGPVIPGSNPGAPTNQSASRARHAHGATVASIESATCAPRERRGQRGRVRQRVLLLLARLCLDQRRRMEQAVPGSCRPPRRDGGRANQGRGPDTLAGSGAGGPVRPSPLTPAFR